MKSITSSDNRIFKMCRQLAEKKYRDRLGLYIAEGENLLNEALKNGASIRYVLVSESAVETGRFAKATGNVSMEQSGEKTDSALAGAEVISLSDRLFSELSETETPQGILAIIEKPILDASAFRKAIDRAPGANIVIFDRLQDPGNIGTMIRTADAAGFGGAVFMKGSSDPYSPKAIRAAAGSVFRMPIFFGENPREVLAMMKDCSRRTVATVLDAEHFYYEEDLARNAAIIIGNEGNGICDEFINEADVKVKIPMKGNIESLNAGVAAALLMYEAIRAQA